MLFPTTLVGSYPQPEWLIDRAKLAGRFPPRTRAKELWRIPEPYLEEAMNDATRLAIKAQEDAGLDIITDGEIRRESYSNRFATALAGVDIDNPGTALDRSGHPNPVPRITGKIKRLRDIEVADLKFLKASLKKPGAQAKMTVPGPFTMSCQAQNDFYATDADAAMDYAVAVNEEIRPLRRRRGRGADRRALHAGAPGKGARVRIARLEPRPRRRQREYRRAHLLRLCCGDPRTSVRLFVPAGIARLRLQAGVARNRPVQPRHCRPEVPGQQEDHPGRD